MNSKLRMYFTTLMVVLAMAVSALAQEAQSIYTCTLITKPGSYMLAKNITARTQDLKSPGPSCIVIVADFVTLDLNGYTITGPGSGFGIYSTANSSGKYATATVVRNGAVANFGRGIALEGAAHAANDVRLEGNGVGLSFDASGSSAEKVNILSNGTGILCFGGSGNSVRHSEVSSSGGNGIDLNACPGSSVIGNTVSGNGGVGITVSCPSVVLQNMASQNGGGDIVADPAACTRSVNNPAP